MIEDRRVKTHSVALGQQGWLYKAQVFPQICLLNSVQKSLGGIYVALACPAWSSHVPYPSPKQQHWSQQGYPGQEPPFGPSPAPRTEPPGGLAAQPWVTASHPGGIAVSLLLRRQCDKTHPHLAQRGVIPAAALPWPCGMQATGGCSNSGKSVGVGWSLALYHDDHLFRYLFATRHHFLPQVSVPLSPSHWIQANKGIGSEGSR